MARSRRHIYRFVLATTIAAIVACAPSEHAPIFERAPASGKSDGVQKANADTKLGASGFYLPCAGGESCNTSQGPGGTFSHNGRFKHASDFRAMPIGTPIRAMKSGRVGVVVQQFVDHEGKCFSSCYSKTNLLVIHHDDGTESAYWHLNHLWADKLGVKVGDKVCRGDVVALSGNTGYSDGAHLHVHIATCCSTTWDEHRVKLSMPMRFVEAGDLPLRGARSYVSRNFPTCMRTDLSAKYSVVVDELDADFSLTGAAPKQIKTAGWNGQFYYSNPSPTKEPTVSARYQPRIRLTGLYWVEAFVPNAWHVLNRRAPYRLVAPGGVQDFTLYQQYQGGIFLPLGGGQLIKLFAGGEAHVIQHNASGDAAWRLITFDAIRFSYIRPARGAAEAEPCTQTAACRGRLICLDGRCAQGCQSTGCVAPKTCDRATQLCLDDISKGGPSKTDK